MTDDYSVDPYGPYDELGMIGNTVMRYQSELLNSLERQIADAFFIRAKTRNSTIPEREQLMWEQCGIWQKPEVEQALERGYDAFLHSVVARLLREQSQDLHLNRCPACGRIVRTPTAQWCQWCKHDWH
ncbi:MAG: hypothetical protein RJA44_1896 [Pseudomonadota bacterium]